MADLRLLAFAALSSVALAAVACAPVWTPRVAGRVVDKATSQPVAGAEVFIHRSESPFLSSYRQKFDKRWQTTDAEGRFDFPGKVSAWLKSRIFLRIWPKPRVLVIDSDYGFQPAHLRKDRSNWTDLVIEMQPHEGFLRSMADPEKAWFLCGSLGGDARLRCCEVIYGRPDPCFRH